MLLPPLGLDLGSTRMRLASADRAGGGVVIRAVVSRNVPSAADEVLAAWLEDAWRELKTPQRYCVCAIGMPHAEIRPYSVPKMSAFERMKSARFEAMRDPAFRETEKVVRLAGTGTENMWVLGTARRELITRIVRICKKSGMRIIAIDYDGLALLRALPSYDAVADLGHTRSALHVRGSTVPATFVFPVGGEDLTRAIADDLSVKAEVAEKRKRIIGTAGAGENRRNEFISGLAHLFERARAAHSFDRVALVGNGARLAGLADDLQRLTGIVCELPVSQFLRGPAYPKDVVRRFSPDWTLAAALTSWTKA